MSEPMDKLRELVARLDHEQSTVWKDGIEGTTGCRADCRRCALEAALASLRQQTPSPQNFSITTRSYNFGRVAELVEALRQWEYWYSVDSTEFNRDTARDNGLVLLKKHRVEVTK